MLSCCFEGSELDDDDVDPDEEDPTLADESEWIHKTKKGRGRMMDPIDEETLDAIRAERIKEIEIWAIVRELLGYIFFVVIVFIISYGNRDTKSYHLKVNIEKNFIKRYQFDKIVTSNDWWIWAHSALIPELRAQSYYNGQPPYGLRGFVGKKNKQ